MNDLSVSLMQSVTAPSTLFILIKELHTFKICFGSWYTQCIPASLWSQRKLFINDLSFYRNGKQPPLFSTAKAVEISRTTDQFCCEVIQQVELYTLALFLSSVDMHMYSYCIQWFNDLLKAGDDTIYNFPRRPALLGY